jgi:hypothetical protein
VREAFTGGKPETKEKLLASTNLYNWTQYTLMGPKGITLLWSFLWERTLNENFGSSRREPPESAELHEILWRDCNEQKARAASGQARLVALTNDGGARGSPSSPADRLPPRGGGRVSQDDWDFFRDDRWCSISGQRLG